MEFIKDQEKRILLSALSREKKVINEHEELAELIPVINQLDYYFMYDRLFKRIYNRAIEDIANKLKSKPYWDDEHNFQAIPIDYIDEVLEEITIK